VPEIALARELIVLARELIVVTLCACSRLAVHTELMIPDVVGTPNNNNNNDNSDRIPRLAIHTTFNTFSVIMPALLQLPLEIMIFILWAVSHSDSHNSHLLRDIAALWCVTRLKFDMCRCSHVG
jgi:hypothetical protein